MSNLSMNNILERAVQYLSSKQLNSVPVGSSVFIKFCVYKTEYLEEPNSTDTFLRCPDGIMTSLEVLYAAIFASLILHMKIPYIEAALQFVQMCQMDRGGFGRMPVGLPDIESTYRALKVLKTCTN